MTRTNAFTAGAAALLLAASSGFATAQTAGTPNADASTQPSAPNSSMQTQGSVGGGAATSGASGATSGSMGSTSGATETKPSTGPATDKTMPSDHGPASGAGR